MKAVGWLVSPLLKATGIIKTPKKAAQPVPLPTANRDDARAAAERDDELRRRRGGAADIVAGGLGGGDASGNTIGKLTLGS